MFISRFRHWLDEVDPYTIQRGALHKALFIATIMAYVYWLFLPDNYLSFIMPFFIVSAYEMPVLSSFRKKEQLLAFVCFGVLIISVSFYLVYPFTVFFFFFSLLGLTVLYFFVLHYFYALKSLIMLTLSTGTIILSMEPQGSLQVAYSFIFSILLSSITIIACLKIFPHQYLRVWNRALASFIRYFETDIDNALVDDKSKVIIEEIIHFQMVRDYQRLVGKKYFLTCYRMVVYIRNIQLSLDNLFYEKKNEAFWRSIKVNLERLRLNMCTYTPCGAPHFAFQPETKLQYYVADCLIGAFIQWNKLCKLRHS